ncbi:hypothetical protein SAMN04488074_104262 [Lentzea albidocapillata subsp. violacea]|uniref:Phosphotransferase enzyme family protein n=1 Tax=Lentzea albidocapillata subsp. violacea TaxID=128104 RepID=A0A1G8Z6Z7_9PSEU|nr:hypothetical protein [Lentzea albidocapillata]SDK10733.1 hypothetical protein SAMN04488074_104262 [Lentzea albidocapillata subsp. violacea]
MAFDPVALTTAAVYRVVSAGESTFVKVLRRPHIPAELSDVVGDFPWRDEADFLLSDFALPPGFRRPRVLRVDDLGDRIALWLEDVRCADVEWDLPRFRRAALALGRWAGRRFGGAPGRALRVLYEGRLVREAFLRPDCSPLARRIPELLARLEALPQATGHNDACPQNLLVPVEDPESFVVIDVAWQCPCPVGADLGQLLVGLAQAGRMAVARLPPVREAIIDAYLEGLHLEHRAVSREEVVLGCDGTLALRSAFHSAPELADYLVERALKL